MHSRMLIIFILHTQSPREHYMGESKQSLCTRTNTNGQLKDRNLPPSVRKNISSQNGHLWPLNFDPLTPKSIFKTRALKLVFITLMDIKRTNFIKQLGPCLMITLSHIPHPATNATTRITWPYFFFLSLQYGDAKRISEV